MSNALWPGAHRAADVLSDAAVIDAMLRVEAAWSSALVTVGIAPPDAAIDVADLSALVTARDRGRLTDAAEADATVVSALVRHLRTGLGDSSRSRWLHRGLTSQDVLDSALMMCARAAIDDLHSSLTSQIDLLAGLADHHRSTAMVARTLTQHAVPTTFGLKAATWLNGVICAFEGMSRLRFPVQIGGAAGTLSAATELARATGDPVHTVLDACTQVAQTLGLEPSPPWHTVRNTITRLGDAAVECTDAWGHIANDVLALSRPEIGELSEGAGGGSSTMPHKSNPTMSALIRRAAVAGPPLAATLHLAAADSVDERAAGGWHLEWETLAIVLQRTVIAGSHTTDLVRGLIVHTDRMHSTLAAAHTSVRSEQQAVADVARRTPAEDYMGAADALITAHLDRARQLRSAP